jgi:hypothetical protein
MKRALVVVDTFRILFSRADRCTPGTGGTAMIVCQTLTEGQIL